MNLQQWRWALLGVATLLVFVLAGCAGGTTQGETVSASQAPGGGAQLVVEGDTPGEATVGVTATREATQVPATQVPATATHIPPTEEPPTSTPQEKTASTICSPLEGHAIDELRLIVSAPYDPPPPGKEERHHGVDFSYYRRGVRTSIQGVGVQAVLDGVVAASGIDTYPYGNFVIIETAWDLVPAWLIEQTDLANGQSLYLVYAHMEEAPQVALGETIGSCQLIGAVGVSGNAVEPHLHLEARVGPAGIDFPEGMAFYHTQTTEAERENYTRWRTGGEFLHFDPMTILVPRPESS